MEQQQQQQQQHVNRGFSADGEATTNEHTTKTAVIATKVAEAELGASVAAPVPPSAHGPAIFHPTTYMESLTHLLRGNIGSGLMAMGDAFKNGGLLVGSLMIAFLGVLCVHNQHILLNCARQIKHIEHLDADPDFADTVQKCFEYGPKPLRRHGRLAKRIVNVFLCVTQLSFCCVYFVFASSSFKQIADHYGWVADVHVHMCVILLPVMLPALVPHLKHLAPVSTAANVFMASGLAVVLYYMLRDFDGGAVGERRLVGGWTTLPLFYGTAIYAFEGIALVLPLRNAMIEPDRFAARWGVLNVGMACVTALLIGFGWLGYACWGERVAGSLTLNLPEAELLAELVKFSIGLCVVLTFALQFFIPIQIMWPSVKQRFGPFRSDTCAELVFRALMVLLTFAVAQLVPHLNIIISLVGALCSTALALFIPVAIELVMVYGEHKDRFDRPTAWMLAKNGFVIVLGCVGLVTGTYESLNELIKVISR